MVHTLPAWIRYLAGHSAGRYSPASTAHPDTSNPTAKGCRQKYRHKTKHSRRLAARKRRQGQRASLPPRTVLGWMAERFEGCGRTRSLLLAWRHGSSPTEFPWPRPTCTWWFSAGPRLPALPHRLVIETKPLGRWLTAWIRDH